MATNFLVEIRSSSLFTEFDENAKFRCVEQAQLCPDLFEHENRARALETDGTPAPELSPPSFLRVSLSQRPKDISAGWVFGSDPAVCDVLIGVYAHGISRKQFAIIPQEDAGRVIIRNLSRHGTHFWEREGDQVTLTPVKSQRGLAEGQLARLVIGAIELDIITAARRGGTYQKQWAQLFAEQQKEGISMNSLTLENNAPSTCLAEYTPQSILISHADHTTFIATERGSQKKVVLKRYAFHKMRSAEREARLLSTIQHDHIVAFLEFIPDPSLDLVFSFFPGRTLDVEHSEQPISFGDFKMLIYQLLRALAYLHGLGLYHGQVEPQNIVLTQRSPNAHIKLHNFNVEPIFKPRIDIIDKDMEGFADLCVLFLTTGHHSQLLFFNMNALEILRSVFSARERGPPPKQAKSLLEDAQLTRDLTSRSGEDKRPLAVKMPSNRTDDEMSSLPDTELPIEWKEDIEIYVHESALGKVFIRKDGPDYELNLSKLIRSSSLSRSQGQRLRKQQSSNCRKEGKGGRIVYWLPLHKAVGLVRELGFNELHDKLRHLAVERDVEVSLVDHKET